MVEINKTATFQATVTLKLKWIQADTEPTPPTGYVRMSDFDIELGALGTLYAFKGTT